MIVETLVTTQNTISLFQNVEIPFNAKTPKTKSKFPSCGKYFAILKRHLAKQ